MSDQEMNLIELMERFGSEDRCHTYLEQLRFPDGLYCIRCESDKISRIYDRKQYHCDDCKYQFSVRTGTIFHGSHLPLQKWFVAIYLMSESKKGISANQLMRTIKVAYKTAWYLCHRIREAVKDADTTLLDGIVEVDETYIGGKARNMHKAVKERKIIGRGPSGKALVVGAIQRDGQVRLSRELATDRKTLHGFIKREICGTAEYIITDDHKAYIGIGDFDTIHESVNHSKGEYVRGSIHTNGIENVWSLFKRSIVGAFHHVSEKHLDRYLDEFEFRFNNRENPYLFRDTVLRLIDSENLEYKDLTKSHTR
ncbi:MAG TPA: IS1595 family transposase [Aridibacter sp.]|nr:IS1595 family transposase [Aridibacter sp.]